MAEWCKRTAVPRTGFSKTALFAGTSIALVGGVAGLGFGYTKLLDLCDRSKKVAIGCNIACMTAGGATTAFIAHDCYHGFRGELKASKNMCQFIGRSALGTAFGVTALVPLGITILAAVSLKENINSIKKSHSSHAYRPPPL